MRPSVGGGRAVSIPLNTAWTFVTGFPTLGFCHDIPPILKPSLRLTVAINLSDGRNDSCEKIIGSNTFRYVVTFFGAGQIVFAPMSVNVQAPRGPAMLSPWRRSCPQRLRPNWVSRPAGCSGHGELVIIFLECETILHLCHRKAMSKIVETNFNVEI